MEMNMFDPDSFRTMEMKVSSDHVIISTSEMHV